MDWDELESATWLLLQALTRYHHPLDPETLLNVAHEQAPDWRARESKVIASYRALGLIDALEMANRPDGINRTITEFGRSFLASPPPSLLDTFRGDPRFDVWIEQEQLRHAMNASQRPEANLFQRLELRRWRQFDSVEIDFHPRLTVITGANGAGKTTLLSVLAPHFSWNAQLISSSSSKRVASAAFSHSVGNLIYANGVRTEVYHSTNSGVQAGPVSLPSQQQVPGIYISSHRSVSGFQPLQTLPARFSTADVLLDQFAGELQTRYLGQNGQYPPLFRMKEALASAALHGYGNVAVAKNDEALAIWEGFQEVLLRLLPRTLAFQGLEVEDGTVMLRTASDRFPLEAVSGGVSALMELGWQIFLRGRQSASFTVCIDEPENHLHPEMQRSIIPALLDAFPLASFIVATHSPFVVTATTDCSVYALRPDSAGVVTSRSIDNLNSSATSDDTLMSVLGLATALPLWAETRLSAALDELPESPSAEDLRTLRQALTDAGLRDQFPAAIESIRRG